MRLFFSLEIDRGSADEIARWRNGSVNHLGNPVPVSNFHMTLLFLGNLSFQQADNLARAADRITVESIELNLDTWGYFVRQGIFWIGPSRAPENLLSLVDNLNRCARGLQLKVDRRSYQPHVTLLRQCHQNPNPVSYPCINLVFQGFSLMQSMQSSSGVSYSSIASWHS